MLNRKNHALAALAVFATILFVGAQSYAAILPSGGTLFPAPGEPDPTGGVEVANLTTPFAVPGFFSGSLTTRVISGDPSNTLGGLTFTYLLTNGTAGPNAMARLTVKDFTGFATDASYQVPTSGVAPAYIDRLTADVIGFSFSGIGAGPIFPGQSSSLLVVQTDAQGWVASTASIIDSGAITVASLGPIPEPATLGLAAFGALALVRRRR
jgi:MYXO-CTERM domain-containing protein